MTIIKLLKPFEKTLENRRFKIILYILTSIILAPVAAYLEYIGLTTVHIIWCIWLLIIPVTYGIYFVWSYVANIDENKFPAGFDIIYQALSRYLLRHTERAIQIKEIQILQRVCKDFQDIDTYLKALRFIKVTAVINERNVLSTQIQEIVEDSQEDNDTKCISLAKILLEQWGSEEKVKSILNCIRKAEVVVGEETTVDFKLRRKPD